MMNGIKTDINMNNEEIKFWVARWKRLPPNDRRNMVIKIWERLIKYKIG
jgi:hypothetical protein